MNSPYSTGTSLWPEAHTTLQLAALTRAILHKVQVKRSEGNTLQVMYRGSMEGDCAPLPLSRPLSRGELSGEGGRQGSRPHFANWKGRNGFTGEEATILPPHSCHLTYCPCPEGGTVGLGSSQEPLTCLWQLSRDQRGVVRVGGAPPSQAVQAPALGVEAVAGQPGLCQSPSQVRWGRGPRRGWEWGQGQQQCQWGVVRGGGPQLPGAVLREWPLA